MTDTTNIARTVEQFGRFLSTPDGARYLARRVCVGATHDQARRLFAWLRARAPFNHTQEEA